MPIIQKIFSNIKIILKNCFLLWQMMMVMAQNILPKTLSLASNPRPVHVSVEHEEVCNTECLDTFMRDMNSDASPHQDHTCYRAPTYAANAMYAQLCTNVLSDLPEHKAAAKNHPGICSSSIFIITIFLSIYIIQRWLF